VFRVVCDGSTSCRALFRPLSSLTRDSMRSTAKIEWNGKNECSMLFTWLANGNFRHSRVGNCEYEKMKKPY
jgi:hypothetical protein